MMYANKLPKLANEELKTKLKDSLVSRDFFGKYNLFGKYSITPANTYYAVAFSEKTLLFSSLKIATAWCILNHAGKYFEVNRVESLDLKLCSIAVDIAVHKNLIRTAKSETEKMIYIIKLQEDNYRRKVVLNELEIYINSSKRIQDKNFLKKDSKFNYV